MLESKAEELLGLQPELYHEHVVAFFYSFLQDKELLLSLDKSPHRYYLIVISMYL